MPRNKIWHEKTKNYGCHLSPSWAYFSQFDQNLVLRVFDQRQCAATSSGHSASVYHFSTKIFYRKNIIGNFVYQGCRIRDGQYGRFNQVVVNFWAYSARIIMMTILLNLTESFTESMYKDILCLAMQPLIWGDTFGEIIGAFFGKHEFEVKGIGEINKKTVEGTIAV